MVERRENTLSTDEVRQVVRDENKGLQDGLNGLMLATQKMTEAIYGLTAQSRVNDEKFANLHKQISHVADEADVANNSLARITSEIIPRIEQEVALNGFSLTAFWKSAAVVVTPICVVCGYLYTEIEAKNTQIVELISTLNSLISGV